MYIVSYTKYPMVLLHVAFLNFFQDSFNDDVHDKQNSFLPAIVVKIKPLVVFAPQFDSTIQLSAIYSVDFQLLFEPK